MKWFGLPIASPSSLKPSYGAFPEVQSETASSPKVVSRRIALIGLASTGVAVAGGGLALWQLRPHPLLQPLYVYRGHSSGVTVLVWSPDSTSIASTEWMANVQVWNATNGDRLSSYKSPSMVILPGRWMGGNIIYASFDGTIRTWNARNDRPRLHLSPP